MDLYHQGEPEIPSTQVTFGYFDESLCTDERILNFIEFNELTRIEDNFPYIMPKNLKESLIERNSFVFDHYSAQVSQTMSELRSINHESDECILKTGDLITTLHSNLGNV